jgi:hypothetical protein
VADSEVEETERMTIEEARRKGGAEGASKSVGLSPVTETGTTYLGVDEPIVLDDETDSSTGDRSTNDTSA